MQAMKDFALWFLQSLPGFLMAEPIIYFIGLFFLAFVVGIFKHIIHNN